jgi:hypothetical protein
MTDSLQERKAFDMVLARLALTRRPGSGGMKTNLLKGK